MISACAKYLSCVLHTILYLNMGPLKITFKLGMNPDENSLRVLLFDFFFLFVCTVCSRHKEIIKFSIVCCVRVQAIPHFSFNQIHTTESQSIYYISNKMFDHLLFYYTNMLQNFRFCEFFFLFDINNTEIDNTLFSNLISLDRL